MSSMNTLGIGNRQSAARVLPGVGHVMVQRPLSRLLAFRGRTIHDVVNDPIVKNEVFGYWKVFKQIERRSELLDLERQWNHLGRRL